VIVVSDASPLIGLAKAQKLRLLFLLYGQVIIPPQVYTDVAVNGRGRAGSRVVRHAVSAGWLRVLPVSDSLLIPRQFSGTGEGEAIALARELHADLILIDDRAARNECARLRLHWLSTGAIIVDARRAGLILRVRPIFDRMQSKGFGIWNYEDLLKAVGEWP